jgi:hypothetical protein
MKTILFLSLVLAAATCCAQTELQIKRTSEVRVEVTVLDEDGKPLTDFPCGVGTKWPIERSNESKKVSLKGNTNEKGIFIAEGRTFGGVGIGTRPPGYYLSHRAPVYKDPIDGKLQPYPIKETLVMKKIINPVPMYAMANLKLTFPAKDGEFGYDLVQRDWVPPHGKGKVTDLVFVQQKNESPYGSKASLRLRLTRPGDGLIPVFELKGGESELRLPRQAPEEGYQAERVLTREWVGGRPMADLANPAEGYLLRVRTELGPDGKVKKAWYGKIDGEFKWEARYAPTGTVEFTYYVNPDGTRNLEFDRKRNLFGELPHGHAVERP